MMPSPLQLLIVVGIVVILFGARRLGDVGKGLGEGIRNFRRGISDDEKEAQRIAKGESDSEKSDS